MSWKTVSSIIEKEVYKYQKHSPQKVKFIPWLMCKSCGLIYLNNRPTRKAVKLGCDWNVKGRG